MAKQKYEYIVTSGNNEGQLKMMINQSAQAGFRLSHLVINPTNNNMVAVMELKLDE